MRNRIIELAGKRNNGQHPGLLLQRYLADSDDDEEKRRLLDAAIHAATNREVRELYQTAYTRWENSLHPELTAAGDLRTEGRLIVGLGCENVLKTGIRLHHTYGFPLLPGSALKGLAAHFCNRVWGATDEQFQKKEKVANFHSLLFGQTEDAGVITFHDAWFVPDSEASPLKLDVMTPHHPGWVDGTEAPTDFDSPIPIPFLSVVGSFRVALTWRGPDDKRAEGWTELAFDLLARALNEWGIGGKTTSGYGRLAKPSNRRQPFSASASGLPAIGSVIEAKLQKAPKKDQPWRAAVTQSDGTSRAGPINGVAPAGIQAGQVVRLIVDRLDKQSIWFEWPK